MIIHIELFRVQVTCLANYLPLGSDLRYALLNADLIPSSAGLGDSIPIECNEGEARALLRIAFEHCPDAVEKIQYGMNVAGVRYS